MPGLIPLIFIIVPIIEITLFVQIGGAIGLGWTLLVILATAMLGARAIRRQGIDALARAQAQMANGKPPVGEIVHGVLILMAGILLLTPGFMTDALGMLVLLPAPRAAMAKYLMSKMTVQSVGGGFQCGFGSGNFQQGPFDQDPFNQQPKDGNTFEGEYERKDGDDNNRLN